VNRQCLVGPSSGELQAGAMKGVRRGDRWMDGGVAPRPMTLDDDDGGVLRQVSFRSAQEVGGSVEACGIESHADAMPVRRSTVRLGPA
jgi:hypothetical protein